MKPYKFIISGGGTGGHIYPAIAIANELKSRYPKAEFLFVGAKDRMEMEKVPQAGYRIVGLWISGLQRKLTLKNVLFPLKLVFSLLKSRSIIRNFQPDVAIGTGGYASAPLLRVAAHRGIPCLIQEQNSHIDFNHDENLLIDLLNHLINWCETIYKENIDSLKEKQILLLLRNKIPKEMQTYLRPHKLQLKKSVLLYYYRKFIKQNRIKENTMVCLLLIKKPANDISGINQITILTSPTPDGQTFSCKHDCFYCPNEPLCSL